MAAFEVLAQAPQSGGRGLAEVGEHRRVGFLGHVEKLCPQDWSKADRNGEEVTTDANAGAIRGHVDG